MSIEANIESNKIRVISWNIARSSDYLGLTVRSKIFDWKHRSELDARRQELFQSTFQSLRDQLSPDLFLLQEVSSLNQVLKAIGDGYEGIHAGSDCAIVWKSERFEAASDSFRAEPREGRFAAIDLVDRQTKKTCRVASAHLWGFDLTAPTGIDSFSREPVTMRGDRELDELLKELESQPKCHLKIVGLDANTTPEIHPERLSRFPINHFVGHIISDDVTAYNSKLPGERAQLDYIFAKGSKKTSVAVLPIDGSLLLPLESPRNNPSDHRPVIRDVQLRDAANSSGKAGLFEKVLGYLKS